MFAKKILPALIVLSLVTMACSVLNQITPPPATQEFPQPSTEAPATQTPQTLPALRDIRPVLQNMGGQPCEENPDYTCVTVQVALDHFDAANTETLGVVFAVLPAWGERYGMYLQAFPGGPGGEGVSTATVSWFDDAILEHYDVVYFDQRGLGLSGELACPTAYAKSFLEMLNYDDTAGLEGFDTPEEQQAMIEDNRAFVNECVAEIGIDPARLAFYGTNQVAEDLETFRQAIGDDRFMLYGVSYGTAVAQAYAAAHPDRLMGMILDGTIDLTLPGEVSAHSQEKAFEEVLLATLQACNADAACAADMGGDAVAAYDNLAKVVSENSVRISFPLPTGETINRVVTFNALEYTTMYQLYGVTDRMMFLRALAQANRGDLVAMARLLDADAMLDPTTGEYLGDPTFSDTMFDNVHCTDNAYFSGAPEERIAQSVQDGQSANGTVPRLNGFVYTGVMCALWPSHPVDVTPIPALRAEGVPTLVLNATLDPATPFHEGQAVFQNLADGYHIYVEGGVHSIYGWGESCPDDLVTDFLVNGNPPAQRETICEWEQAVTAPYVPILAKDASAYSNPLDLLMAIDDEIRYTPEYYNSSFAEDQSFGCRYGGTFTFGPSDVGETYRFETCGFLEGFSITGTGSYDYDSGVFTLEMQVTGAQDGNLTYTRKDNEGTYSLIGTYGGQDINLNQ
ncbi:MAG: alpha/beta fold hydrolase [Chloroflexi bacterium]|nr:alpha/beta fold hydrolase [Chloroflexota bacterium]